MTNELFNVFWEDPDGNTHKELEFATVMDAVEKARSLSQRPAAKLGVIRKIIITDGDDFTCFLWKDGKVIYPDEVAINTSRVRHDH